MRAPGTTNTNHCEASQSSGAEQGRRTSPPPPPVIFKLQLGTRGKGTQGTYTARLKRKRTRGRYRVGTSEKLTGDVMHRTGTGAWPGRGCRDRDERAWWPWQKRPVRGRTGVDVWPRARGGRGEHESGRTLRELARA
jgi:hypothetical protein